VERLKPQDIDPTSILIAVGIAVAPLIVWAVSVIVLSLERVAS
jgi:hypothetical protein